MVEKLQTTKRKKMSCQDGSITVKAGKYDTENENLSGKELNDKALN